MNRSDDVDVLDPDRLLREWRWLCPQRVTIIDRNAYGDLFLRDESGRIHKLDVGSGEFAPVAGSMSEFDALRDTPEKREEWFAEADARDAAQRGLVPNSMQCIAFDIPVVFAESVNASPYLADIYEHLGCLGDMHRQLSNLPDGSTVKLVIKPKTDTA
jgi:hypothetical protein